MCLDKTVLIASRACRYVGMNRCFEIFHFYYEKALQTDLTRSNFTAPVFTLTSSDETKRRNVSFATSIFQSILSCCSKTG